MGHEISMKSEEINFTNNESMTMKNLEHTKVRIKNVLLSLINNDQTGFMKDRLIGANIRLIDSVFWFPKELK